MRVLIVGSQGAGKGTQAALLSGHPGVPHISTGDIFRSNVSVGNEMGVLAKRYMDAGELVPDEVTSAMVACRLAEPDANGRFLLGGFPRTVPQAGRLGALLRDLSRTSTPLWWCPPRTRSASSGCFPAAARTTPQKRSLGGFSSITP